MINFTQKLSLFMTTVLLCSGIFADSLRDSTPNAQDGLKIQYYFTDANNAFYQVPDFDSMTPDLEEVSTNLWFSVGAGENILNSGRADYLAIQMTGYLDVPQDAQYTFYLNSYDGSKLYLDDKLLIDNDGIRVEREFSERIRLKAGLHTIKVGYFKVNMHASLQVYWSTDSMTKRLLDDNDLWYVADVTQEIQDALNLTKDSDSDGITDIDENNLGTDPLLKDSDGDGIDDYAEVNIYDTNPLSVDTDGDSFSDAEEINILLSDPKTADLTNQVVDIASINGSDGSVVRGDWAAQGGSIYAVNYSGTVKYVFNVPVDGVFRLAVNLSEKSLYPVSNDFFISLVLDGAFPQKAYAELNEGQGIAYFILPQLSSGNHNFIINWDNITRRTSLQIDSLILQKLNGPDNDGNGIPDWLDSRNAKTKVIQIPQTTFVSPVCVEGNENLNVGLMQISGYYVNPNEDDEGITLKPAPDNKWYADVPLNPDAPTVLTFNYPDGPVTKTVEWIEMNTFTTSNMTVRLNDSLLIAAYPQGATTGTSQIDIDGQTFTINYDSSASRNSIAYKFKTPGDYVVNATYTPSDGSQSSSASLNVRVVAGTFSEPPVSILKSKRTWDSLNMDTSVVLQADSFINFNKSYAYPSGIRVEYSILESKTGYMLARLWDNGPILDSSPIKYLETKCSQNGKMVLIETFDDGSKLLENSIYLSEVPDDIKIQIDLWTAGVMFEDGTTFKEFTKDDFDEYGVLTYRIIQMSNTDSAACHIVYISQGDNFLREY